MRKKVLMVALTICFLAIGLGVGTIATVSALLSVLEDYRKNSDKFTRLFRIMNKWVQLKQEGKSLISYFKENNYREIAIYGMGDVGTAMIRELVDSDIDVKYAIDQKAGETPAEFIISPDSVLDKVDAIIVTPILSYDEIKQKLKEKVDCPIISIEDVLYEI